MPGKLNTRVEQLEDSESRVWKSIAALTEKQEKLDDALVVLLEAQAKTEELFQEVGRRFRETDERFRKTDERFRETDERFRKTDERLSKTDKRFHESSRQLDERIAKLVSAIGELVRRNAK